MLKTLFPILFLILSLIHLYSCLKGKSTLRMFTKVLLMPLLAVCWMLNAQNPSALVLAGILLGGFGDLALLWPLKKLSFFLGELSFMLGHVCYIIYLFSSYSIDAGIFWPLFVTLIYLAGGGFVYISTRKEIPPVLRPGSFVYMLFLSALSAVTLLVLITKPGLGTALAFSGATLFLASDGILSQMLFVKKKESNVLNFVVMLSYIAAQTLLSLGWAIA